MNLRSNFGLALGMIVLLSNQVFAGEVTEWVNENKAAISTTGLLGGGAMFVISGVGTDVYADKLSNANKRLGSPEERKYSEKRLKDAELKYQAEKAKLEEIVAVFHEQSKRSNVISLEAVRQRKVVEQAKEEYKYLQDHFESLEKRISREAVTSPNMIKAAEKDLKSAKRLFNLSYLGLATSIPLVVVPGTTAAIVSHRMEKAKAEAASAGSREPASVPSQFNASAL